jgi:hypothetical protein
MWLLLLPWQAQAQSALNTYGMPGLVEMPAATPLPDADLAGTVSYFDRTTRSTLTFQAAPRITAAFRYSGLEELGGQLRDTLFDRSFDLHVLLLRADASRPAIALGFRDFIGTGVYSGEYIVADKTVGRWTVSGGVGWGRLGRSGYAARAGPTRSTNQGGQFETTRWFSGDPAVFAGLSWRASDRIRLMAEYSADSYLQETSEGVMARKTQVNLGLDWRLSKTATLKLFYLHGTELGFAVHLQGNPARTRVPSGTHSGPAPLRLRPAERAAPDWRAPLAADMARDGLEVIGLERRDEVVRLDFRNQAYGASAEALGRAARHLARHVPGDVEVFDLVPVEAGLRSATVRVFRRDLERLVHDVDGTEALWQRVRITEAPSTPLPAFDPGAFPRFNWGLGPYAQASFFDPDRPVMVDLGLRLSAEWAISPRAFVSGSVRKSLAGNFGDSDRVSDSVLPKVRSDANRYLAEGDPALETLSFAYYFRPARKLYGRLTLGYLETQYGGLSAELLWKPVDSALALGAEINYVRQRDFDQGFGFRDYEVVTGHLSAYYAFENGYHAQIDIGRYLAGDWGATVSLDREFRNGWRIGAYATLTDVSFEDFGEGSFDKGLRFTIPLEPFLGRPTRRSYGLVLQPLTRDGGARVQVDGRLYEQVRAFHRQGLSRTWGRVWR